MVSNVLNMLIHDSQLVMILWTEIFAKRLADNLGICAICWPYLLLLLEGKTIDSRIENASQSNLISCDALLLFYNIL